MEQTILNGKPVWFAVCAKNDCNACLIGPYTDLDRAKQEANVEWCDYAHFVIPKAIEWMEIIFVSDNNGTWNWVEEHNEKARSHPNFSHSFSEYTDDDYKFAHHHGSRIPNGVAPEFIEAAVKC